MSPRIRAFLIHLAISSLVALLSMCLVFLVWYPSPLAKALGVTPIFLMMLGIDVVIGPLLTLLVYKVGKKTLRMDLTIIVILQLAALSYGVWTMAQARPAWIVFSGNRFDIVQSHLIDTTRLDVTKPAYRNASWTGPVWIAATAGDSEESSDILFDALAGGPDLPQRIDLYSPLDQAVDAMRAKALPLSDLNKYNPTASVTAVLKQWPDADAYLPLMAKVQPMTVLLRKSDSKVIAVVALQPWE